MTEIAYASARVLADKLRRGELSSLELVDHFLARIARTPADNAVVTLDAERARRGLARRPSDRAERPRSAARVQCP